jgi:hypothetical protein
MIRLKFESSAGGRPKYIGSAPWFRVVGNFIRQGSQGNVVATYRNHFWEVRDRHFTRYDCEGPAMISFENAAGEPSEVFGPSVYISCADGVVYADEQILANLQGGSVMWHYYPTDTYWQTLVLSAP